MTEGTPVSLAGARKVAPFAPDLLQTTEHHLCSGCGHPVAWRLLVEVLDELNLVDRSIGVVGHGCYTQIITTADVEFLQCLHGRAPAVATGMKRMLPDRAIYTLQGDGDMVSEGLAEVLHIAARGESITCLLLDNGVFGDTGGQMTATTTVGQRTKTDVAGRAPAQYGYPIPIADLVAQFPGVAYVARGAVDRPNAVSRTRRYLRQAFESQLAGEGFSLVEILTMCPTGWSVPADQGAEYQRDQRNLTYPLGELPHSLTVDVRIHDILTRAAAIAPARCGATLGDEQRTFAELDVGSNRAAHRLAAEGVAPLDRVVWWGPTDLAALDVCYGVTKLGAALAPINPGFTESEGTNAIAYLRPRIVVVHPTYEGPARSIATALDLPVVVTSSGWLDGAASAPLPRVGKGEDPSAIFLTSGSTGVSKAALLSHRATWLRAIARETEDGSPGPKGEVVMFGLFHMAGWYFLEHAWAVNRPVHLVHRADADELLAAVERWRAGTLYAIPAVWERILADGAAYDASSLREVLTGTSRVDLDLVDALKARFPGTWTSVAYGSTEIGRGAVLTDADLYVKPLSVGLPPPAVEARIDADDELLQRGPTMFSGYLDRPDATADAIDADGWYHTGDLASCDADGYLTITGRRSEGIRSGGEWIAPVEVEAAVLTHPAVAEVGVVGLPDPRWGELVCAAIVARPGATVPTVDELRAHVASRLVAAKHPRVVVAVERLPHTDATGQIRRAALRAEILADGGHELG